MIFFRFDPSLMPFVEKSYEVLKGGRRLSFGGTPDASALAGQLMRHREHRGQQQQLQQVGMLEIVSTASKFVTRVPGQHIGGL